MKFLVLAVCVCAANAAVPRYRPQQTQPSLPPQPPHPSYPSQPSHPSHPSHPPHPSHPSHPLPPNVPKPGDRPHISNDADVNAEVLKSDIDVFPDGYAYTYETANGISAAATGTLKTVDKIDALVVQGSYQYEGPDGVPVHVEYIADENGYQPKSDFLPTPPPTPIAIARALEYLAAHPPEEA